MKEFAITTARYRRILRFSVRGLFVLVSVVAIWIARMANEARHQRHVVEVVVNLGAEVTYDYQLDASFEMLKNARMPGPEWLRDWIGEDFFINVSHISFFGKGICDAQFESMVDDLARLRKLRGIDFWDSDVSDDTLELVGIRFRSLYWLDVPSKKITDDGLIHLRTLTDLQHLGLFDSNINGTGIAHLSALPSLERLYLQRAKLTDVGLQSISRLKNLRELALSGNREISNAGLKSLAVLHRLESLSLMNCWGLTDECLIHLESLTNLTSLRTAGSRITPGAEKVLRKKLPKLK